MAADRTARTSKLERAAALLERAADLFEGTGAVHEAASALLEAGQARLDAFQLGLALPLFERGRELATAARDERLGVQFLSGIADVLWARGELDEALRIRREEELPIYEKLGDIRARAVTMGKIAGVLSLRGDLDQALRLYEEDVLPIYERLGDRHALALDGTNAARCCHKRGRPGDLERGRRILEQALAHARAMALPIAHLIELMLRQVGPTTQNIE